jgi:hypothetical protein
MKLELKYQDTCGEQAGKHQAVAYCWHSPAWTFFYMIYMMYFSCKCTEKPVVQVCIKLSQFSTIKENMKQISQCLTRAETQRELICSTVSYLQLQSKWYKINGSRDTA